MCPRNSGSEARIAEARLADAGFLADQARRYIGEPRFHLATRPLLPQDDGAARIVAHDVERVLADIDADHGDRGIGCLRHGVLLVVGAPCQLRLLAGQEHGQTNPINRHWETMVSLPSRSSTLNFAETLPPTAVGGNYSWTVG